MIVDPWGEILACADEKEDIIYSNLDSEKILSVRNHLPILKNKRKDIYETVEIHIKK